MVHSDGGFPVWVCNAMGSIWCHIIATWDVDAGKGLFIKSYLTIFIVKH